MLSINAGRHWPRRRRLVCIFVVILARALVDSSERPVLILDVIMVNYSLYNKKKYEYDGEVECVSRETEKRGKPSLLT